MATATIRDGNEARIIMARRWSDWYYDFGPSSMTKQIPTAQHFLEGSGPIPLAISDFCAAMIDFSFACVVLK